MTLGTTPTVIIEVEDIDFSVIDIAEVTFKQNNLRKVVKSGGDLVLDPDEQTITAYLTQEESLKFIPDTPVGIQVRLKLLDESVTASDIIWEEVRPVLNNQVM